MKINETSGKIQFIRSQFTEDQKKNIDTVFSYMNLDSDHEEEYSSLLDEILSTCDEKNMAILTSYIEDKSAQFFSDQLFEAKLLTEQHDFDEALSLCNDLEKQVLSSVEEKPDALLRLCFSPMEYALTDHYFPSGEMTILPFNYPALLTLKAQILFIQGAFEESQNYIQKALEIDPVSMDILFASADMNKARKNWIRYETDLEKMYQYMYSLPDIRKYYAYLSKYHKDYKKDLRTSALIDKFLVNSKANTMKEMIDAIPQNFKEKLLNKDIPLSLPKETIDVAKFFKDLSEKDNDVQAAEGFHQILEEISL